MKKINILILIAIFLIPSSIIYAVMFDTETSANNTITASTLDISFSTTNTPNITLSPDSNTTVNTQITNIGILPSTNSLTFSYKSGNSDLANDINLTVGGDTLYSGKLSSLSITGIPLLTAKNISFTFNISKENAIKYQGQSVTFQISDLAVQDISIFPNGFYDSESMEFTIIIPTITEIPLQASIEPVLMETIQQTPALTEESEQLTIDQPTETQQIEIEEIPAVKQDIETLDPLIEPTKQEIPITDPIPPEEPQIQEEPNLTMGENIGNEENI